jgi:hypothetical protein
VVENETTKNVQWLPGVGESTGVVCEESERVVFVLGGRLAQEGKGPSDCNVMGRLPFIPDSFVSFLGALCHGALQ